MPIEILMPALSPTMKEGNLAKWVKKEGDNVSAGEVIAEIETDKATMEVEAVDEGKIGKILVSEGSKNVAVNNVIALLLEDGEDDSVIKNYKPKSEPKKEPEKEEKKEVAAKAPAKPQAPQIKPTAPQTITLNKTPVNQDISASPVAKKIAEQNSINIAQIKGTGPRGRITKEDVMAFLENPGSSDLVVRNSEEYSAIENNNIRTVIANRLLEAKQTIPHFYLNLECDISNLNQIRNQVNAGAPKDESGRPSYKISVNDLVIKACALALKKVPAANSSWTDEAVLRYNNVDISVAVAIPDGLITPIIRNADQKSIKAISKEMKELAKKARDGLLQPEEFQGGSFSISNLGMYGIKQFNAIVNPPQGAIIAIGAGEKKVVIDESGNFKATEVMNASLSCDHRVIDGAVGAEFLQSFKYFIENPANLLI